MHVERVGRGGEPVVFIHGFGTCAFLWRAIAPRLADGGYTAIALDLLGHGESDRSLDMSYTLPAQAEYVERALTALRVPAVSIIGQDIGGIVGLLLAGQRPRRVVRLMLLNPPDPDELPPPEVRAMQRTSIRTAFGANALFGALPLLDPLLRAAVAHPEAMTSLHVARYLAPFVGSDGVSHLLQLASAVDLGDDETNWTANLRAPITLVHGDADPWCARSTLDSLATRLNGAAVRAIPGAGHLVAEDAPDALLAMLGEWLEAAPGGTQGGSSARGAAAT